MAKPTKKRIDEVAAKLYAAFGNVDWAHCCYKTGWRRVAKYVLTELQPSDDYKMPPFMGEAAYRGALARRLATKRRNPRLGVAGPKFCKLVRGKAVCK